MKFLREIPGCFVIKLHPASSSDCVFSNLITTESMKNCWVNEFINWILIKFHGIKCQKYSTSGSKKIASPHVKSLYWVTLNSDVFLLFDVSSWFQRATAKSVWIKYRRILLDRFIDPFSISHKRGRQGTTRMGWEMFSWSSEIACENWSCTRGWQ